MTDEVTDQRAATFKTAGSISVDPADWAVRAAAVRQALLADDLPATDMNDALNAFRFLDDAGRTWMYNGSEWLVWDGQKWGAVVAPPHLMLQPFEMERISDVEERPPAGVEPLDMTSNLPEAPINVAGPQPAIREPSAAEIAAAAISPPVVVPVPVAVAPAPAPAAVPGPVVPQPGAAQPATSQPTPPPPPPPAQAYQPTHFVPPSGAAAWSRPDGSMRPEFQLAPGLDVMVTQFQPNGWAQIVCSNGWSGWVDGRLLVPGRL